MKAVSLNGIRPRFEFTARVREQEQESKVGSGDQSSEEQIFEESFGVETEGSVYHPNFLDFSLAGLFGLTQQKFEDEYAGRERTFSEDGDLYEFDFEGRFLKKKKYPGSVYAKRHRTLEPRAFQSSLETTTTTEGFLWQYVDPKMPTNLQYNQTKVLLDPLDPAEEEGRQENSNLRFETGYKFTDQHALSFSYNHQSVSEQPFDLDYDTDEATLSHRLDFGDRRQFRLESEWNYFDQRGTFDNRRNRWRETFRIEHTESLRSWYQFEFLDRDQGSLAGVPPIHERSYLLTGTLEHEWYDSLVSQFSAYGQRQDFDAGLEIERMGILPSMSYRKKNPWGNLLAAYRFRMLTEDRQGIGVTAEVLDEPRTFRDPEPVVLGNANVLIPSIFITAEDRTTEFRATRDYRVTQVGNFVEIERVPTGRIRDGQTVLIDYLYRIGGDYNLDTVGHDFDIRQNFPFGLSPYYRMRFQDQDISPRNATGITPEDITAHLFGLEYNRGPFRTFAEYEDFDSNINPFRAMRVSAEFTHQFPSGGTGRLMARWSDIDRLGSLDRQTEFYSIEGRFRQTLRKQLTLEAAVLHRFEDDSESGSDRGIDVDFSLEWLVRDTEVRLIYEYGQFEDDFSDSRSSTLFLQFVRRF